MRKELSKDKKHEPRPVAMVQHRYPRHPITMENTPEETIRRMQGFPERAAKFRELIRSLREKDEGSQE
jgi:hypothetical protein